MHPLLRIAVALTAGAVSIQGQETLYTFPAQTTHRSTAAPVESLGDVDGDGGADFALGQALGGGVEVRSGASGQVLFGFPDPGLDALYATSLARIGDLDGDGRDDLAVGSSNSLRVGSAGFVELRSTAGGGLLLHVPGPVNRSFGYAVEAIDDLDGDGLEDLIVGDPENFSGPDGPTSVQAISSADGATLWTVERPNGDLIGRVLARLEDLDGDGADELAIASLLKEQGDGRTGIVRIHRSVDGALVRVHRSLGPHGAFGASLAGGDLDGDGWPDLIVGQSILELVAFEGDLGAVLAFSGRDGRLLFEKTGDSPQGELGNALAFLGDADGDGCREVVSTGLFDAHFSAFGEAISLRKPRLPHRARPQRHP